MCFHDFFADRKTFSHFIFVSCDTLTNSLHSQCEDDSRAVTNHSTHSLYTYCIHSTTYILLNSCFHTAPHPMGASAKSLMKSLLCFYESSLCYRLFHHFLRRSASILFKKQHGGYLQTQKHFVCFCLLFHGKLQLFQTVVKFLEPGRAAIIAMH